MTMAAAATTVCAQFQATAVRHAGSVALRDGADGRSWSWSEYADEVAAAAAALTWIGLRRGDVCAIWLGNRPALRFVDTGAMHLGVASLALHETVGEHVAEALLADAGARVLVTGAAHVETAIAIRARGRTRLEHIVCVDGDAPEALGWDELLELAAAGTATAPVWRDLGPGDAVALVYTSGTGGDPRLVELTHGNVIATAQALAQRLGLAAGTRAVSSLSPADAAERVVSHYLAIAAAWEVVCCPAPRALAGTLLAARPSFVLLPPRRWELLRRALDDGAAAGDGRPPLERVGLDGVRTALVGLAPCPDELLAFWQDRGLALTELYGLAEAGGAVAVAAPGDVRIGTVGPPLPGCEARVDDGGELHVRGPGVATGKAGEDRWLRTGDLGRVDGDGHVSVVARVDEVIVTGVGTPMAAGPIEATIRSHATLIGDVCVVGDGRPFNAALVTLDHDAVARLLDGGRPNLWLLVRSRTVLDAVSAEIDAANARLPMRQRVRRFLLLADEWRPDGTLLTPTGKLRRAAVAARYAREIDALYDAAIGVSASPATDQPVRGNHKAGRPYGVYAP